MGCYGIGIERLVAAVVEQNHDEKGIIWPMNIAPFQVCIVLINREDEKQNQIATDLYHSLNAAGIETLLDDRNERPGVKFNDMDLTGIPIRVTVGKKVNEDQLEVKLRNENEIKIVEVKDVEEEIKKTIESK